MRQTLEFILLKTTLFIMMFINILLIVQHPKVPALQKMKEARGPSHLLFLGGGRKTDLLAFFGDVR